MWKTSYHNDIGSNPDNESYTEWYEISNGTITYTTSKYKDAKALKDLLNDMWSNK